jgi:NADH-quinone oxidoreductase subunit N
MMLILMCSLAGLPPLVGFDAKLLILQALLQSDRLWLAVVAVMFSLIGAFYYLRVIKVVYFDEPTEPVTPIPAMGAVSNGLMLINGSLVLVLGLVPGPLMALCLQVMHATLSN